MEHYDFIFAGGGLAGLSLALQIALSPLSDASILIVDQDAKLQDDHTWGFWSNRAGLYDEIVSRSWDQIQFYGEDYERLIDLGDYRYQVIRGADLYRFANQKLSAFPNVHFLNGKVTRIQDGADRAWLTVNDQTVSGTWIFDSLFKASQIEVDPARYHYLKMCFKGWEIETEEDLFEARAATLLDFRTPQKHDVRFFYVLPYSERRALVEYTLFSAAHLCQSEYQGALKAYIQDTLGIQRYRILGRESGGIPVTDYPFPRRTGQRIMAIGLKGGRLKPTAGYAFTRIQKDSAAILRSLLENGHPFDVPADPERYRLMDALLLDLMCLHGEQIKPVFTALFKNNPVERIFRLLDEEASVQDLGKIITSLPPAPFLGALFRLSRQKSRSWQPVQELVAHLSR
jgi:lycopene beta-cyclase